jgi:hypothetical protein
MAGVPSGLLDQVKQHPAQIAVDDVGPGTGVLEGHRRSYVTRRVCCGFVTIYPLLDRLVVLDEEVLIRDVGLPLRPPIGKSAAGDNTLEPPLLPTTECFSRPSSERELAVGARRASVSLMPRIFRTSALRCWSRKPSRASRSLAVENVDGMRPP